MSAKTTAASRPAQKRAPLRIVLADDHAFMRELISANLSQHNGRYEVVAQVGTAPEAIAVCEKLTPDVLILDINLPGMTGIEAIPDLKRVSPATRILLCSGSVSEKGIVAALRTGADGFMEKTNSWDVFLEALERISEGDNYFCARSSRLLSEIARGLHTKVADAVKAKLSQREREVLGLIASGRTNKEIASKLFLSVATVDTHRANLMNKVGVRNVAGLMIYAARCGLLASP